jgi:hypothetical protein
MENLNEQINRIKSMMGLILESNEPIPDENSLIELITNNGFKKVEKPEEVKKYGFTLGLYDWMYINTERKTFTYKFKEDKKVFIGVKSKYDHKNNKEYGSSFTSVNYPFYPINYDDYINAPIVDETWDLDSIVKDLDSVRNLYVGFIVKDETTGKPKYVESNNPLKDEAITVMKQTIVEKLNSIKQNIEKYVSEEEKTKSITSEKDQKTYSNFNEYITFIENEAKNIGIY